METGCSTVIFLESTNKERAGRNWRDRTHRLNVASKPVSGLKRFHG